MTRSPSDLTPAERRAADVSARAKIRQKMVEDGFDAETERWFDALFYGEHATPEDAARAVGMTLKKVRHLLGMPRVIHEIQRRVATVRTIEGPRNFQVLRHIRELAMEKGASAAQQKASIEAMKLIEGRSDEDRRVSVNVGMVFNTPGLVIDLSAYSPAPNEANGRRVEFLEDERGSVVNPPLEPRR